MPANSIASFLPIEARSTINPLLQLKLLRDEVKKSYDQADKLAKKAKKVDDEYYNNKIKNIDKEIDKIKEQTDAKLKLLEIEQQKANYDDDLRKAKLDYEQALASGDMVAAAEAQANVQKLIEDRQRALTTQNIQDRAAAEIKKLEDQKKKLQEENDRLNTQYNKIQANFAEKQMNLADLDSKISEIENIVLRTRANGGIISDIDRKAIDNIMKELKDKGGIFKEYADKLMSENKPLPGEGGQPPKSFAQTLVDKLNVSLGADNQTFSTAVDKFDEAVEKFLGKTDVTNPGVTGKGGVKAQPTAVAGTKTGTGANTKYYDAAGNQVTKEQYNSMPVGAAGDKQEFVIPSNKLNNTVFADRLKVTREFFDVFDGKGQITVDGYTYYANGGVKKGKNLVGQWYADVPGSIGKVKSYNMGGMIQHFGPGGGVSGPGTATSDSIPAYLSNGEYVIKASSVDKYGVETFDALNAQRFATGGKVKTPWWKNKKWLDSGGPDGLTPRDGIDYYSYNPFYPGADQPGWSYNPRTQGRMGGGTDVDGGATRRPIGWEFTGDNISWNENPLVSSLMKFANGGMVRGFHAGGPVGHKHEDTNGNFFSRFNPANAFASIIEGMFGFGASKQFNRNVNPPKLSQAEKDLAALRTAQGLSGYTSAFNLKNNTSPEIFGHKSLGVASDVLGILPILGTATKLTTQIPISSLKAVELAAKTKSKIGISPNLYEQTLMTATARAKAGNFTPISGLGKATHSTLAKELEALTEQRGFTSPDGEYSFWFNPATTESLPNPELLKMGIDSLIKDPYNAAEMLGGLHTLRVTHAATGTPAGELFWDSVTGTAKLISVNPEHQRKGIATWMNLWASTHTRFKHSRYRTPQGRAYSEAIGGIMPDKPFVSTTLPLSEMITQMLASRIKVPKIPKIKKENTETAPPLNPQSPEEVLSSMQADIARRAAEHAAANAAADAARKSELLAWRSNPNRTYNSYPFGYNGQIDWDDELGLIRLMENPDQPAGTPWVSRTESQTHTPVYTFDKDILNRPMVTGATGGYLNNGMLNIPKYANGGMVKGYKNGGLSGMWNNFWGQFDNNRESNDKFGGSRKYTQGILKGIMNIGPMGQVKGAAKNIFGKEKVNKFDHWMYQTGLRPIEEVIAGSGTKGDWLNTLLTIGLPGVGGAVAKGLGAGFRGLKAVGTIAKASTLKTLEKTKNTLPLLKTFNPFKYSSEALHNLRVSQPLRVIDKTVLFPKLTNMLMESGVLAKTAAKEKYTELIEQLNAARRMAPDSITGMLPGGIDAVPYIGATTPSLNADVIINTVRQLSEAMKLTQFNGGNGFFKSLLKTLTPYKKIKWIDGEAGKYKKSLRLGQLAPIKDWFGRKLALSKAYLNPNHADNPAFWMEGMGVFMPSLAKEVPGKFGKLVRHRHADPMTLLHELGHRDLDIFGNIDKIGDLLKTTFPGMRPNKSSVHEFYGDIFAQKGIESLRRAFGGKFNDIRSRWEEGLAYGIRNVSGGVGSSDFVKVLKENLQSAIESGLGGRAHQINTEWFKTHGALGRMFVPGVMGPQADMLGMMSRIFDKYGVSTGTRRSDYPEALKKVAEAFGLEIPENAAEAVKVLKSDKFFSVLGKVLPNLGGMPGLIRGITGTNQNNSNGMMNIPKFENGINMVPADMLAMLHKNEAVVPANMNPFNPNANNATMGGAQYNVNVTLNGANMDPNDVAKVITRELKLRESMNGRSLIR